MKCTDLLWAELRQNECAVMSMSFSSTCLEDPCAAPWQMREPTSGNNCCWRRRIDRRWIRVGSLRKCSTGIDVFQDNSWWKRPKNHHPLTQYQWQRIDQSGSPILCLWPAIPSHIILDVSSGRGSLGACDQYIAIRKSGTATKIHIKGSWAGQRCRPRRTWGVILVDRPEVSSVVGAKS